MEPLYDVNLHSLADEQLVGPWRVSSRVLSQADPNHLLARAVRFRLGHDRQLAISTDEPADAGLAGSWGIRRDVLLNRPYMELLLPEGPVRALITRLRRSPTGSARQLTLYFQSGMELLLDCE